MENGKKSRIDKKLILKTAGAFIIIGYLLSGIYTIKPEEEGVLLRFGKVVDERIPPGMHYKLPYPVDTMYRVRIRETKRISIGYDLPDAVLGRVPDASQTEFFTGDKNIINILYCLPFLSVCINTPLIFFPYMSIRNLCTN